MDRLIRPLRWWRWLAAALLLAGGTPAALATAPAVDLVTVQAGTVVSRLRTYGEVEPMAIVRVRAVEPGTLGGLRVVPGSRVVKGAVLARIGGPRMASLLTAREQTLRAARAGEQAAADALRITRRQFAAELATRQAVDAARGRLAAAQAAVQTARARLHEARQLQIVRAPTDGSVISVPAANGEQIAAGEPLLTLQPAGRLWVRAGYYGADAALLHVGMAGRFRPAAGGAAVAVEVAAVSPALAADDGLRVGLLPAAGAPPAWWRNGQWGTVTLDGPSHRMVAVPTEALILDRGRWWVLVHTPAGDRPQRVVPGPTRGWRTWIAAGLRPGQQVVAHDAYLEFHRGIARAYTPPD
jgi:RND family efflux transporter MFP subunit